MDSLYSLFVLLMIPTLLAPPAGNVGPRAATSKAKFTMQVNEQVFPYQVNGVFVLPQEQLTLQAFNDGGKGRYVLRTASGTATQTAPAVWQWRAPQKPGLYPLTVTRAGSTYSITLNVFVMIPFQGVKKQRINGYRIGAYPRRPARLLQSHTLPRGFIEVTPENQDALVAPHFRLKQFLCKQDGSYPKYVVLREHLLWKLEAILEKLNTPRHRYDTLHIMSGYRTPSYNQAIGNVRHSRHMWGDAADIFVDAYPQDGKMDDLNRDGKINARDAAVLYKIIDDMYGRKPSPSHPLVGGLAKYAATPAHGPFVHVDVRGQRARWGN
ncbi:MAG: D-Ala-D-Ala carboxypeptidase family metallohydrolase [Candidatus Binatia bacterium]